MSDFVNKIKTKDGEEYGINDLRIPTPTIADAGKALGIDANGELAYIQAGSPAPVVEKGSVITLGGEEYKVLSANNDLTDVELVHLGPATISKWYNGSPTSDQKIDFDCDDSQTRQGPKYDGSLVDTYCNETFYDTLPADVKAAIIDQEVFQDMYNLSPSEGDEDIIIDNSSFGGIVYRLKKINTSSVSAGNKHCYMLGISDIMDYYGITSSSKNINPMLLAKDFQLQE